MTGLTAMAVTAPPASAAHLRCGSMVMASTKLAADIGPCAGDGLLLMGSNINLNLNGKKIFAANGPGDNAGIRVVAGMTGVAPTLNTVRNGIVDGFDAGVYVIGGSRNTVTRITAQNNINDRQSLGEPAPGVCDLGEGIIVQNSSDNMITSNSVVNNGPFGGITVLENSDRNQIRNNRVKNNNVRGDPAVVGGRAGCGNAVQDSGIRIEGPGADDNVVDTNIVEGSLLGGISLHGYVCGDPAANTPPNRGTMVRGNMVSGTTNPVAIAPVGNSSSNGISFLQQGPAGVVCPAFNNTVTANTSQNNQGNGIFVPTNSANNTISGNKVLRNGNSGINVGGPVFGNVFTNVGPTLFDVITPDRAPFVFTPLATATSEYLVQSGSGSGDVTARLVAIDIRFTAVGGLNTNPVDTSTSGCEQADYTAAGFMTGNVALIQRGTCTFDAKIALAVANGASAVVLFNEGQAGRTTAAFGGVGPRTIPLLTTTFAVGVELTNTVRASSPVTVRITTNTTNVPLLRAPGAGGNTLNANIGRNNLRFDGEDVNVDCGTNNWSNNDFLTVNQHCVDPDSMVPPPALPAGAGPATGGSDTVDANRGSVASSNS